ncbi:MAG: efflux RND transporter permease subunit [Anaerohalosphaeraceae bacterium]|nr:efflux RND transporter permease subunit [Anaerohalosphaeraceae bacterium]
MFLSNASIRRPIAMSCLIIGLTLLGINAYRKMGIELMPKMELPYITIVTVYPGASPEQIETDVAKRIEDKVVSIDGLKHVNSACMENVCQTLLEFELDVDVDIAATDVREKLDLIRADFPEDVEDPKILKFDINAKPVAYLALTGNVPVDELYDYADNTLRDRITVISGVADVDLVGGAQRQVRVKLDRRKLAARGLTSMHTVKAIQEGLRTIPSGRISENGTEYSVKFDADYTNVSEIGTLEVANEQGQRCYINDIGRVEMSTEELRQKATVNGRPCIAIKIIKKAEANAVRVVDRTKKAMAKLNEQLPGGMELIWISDDGTFIEATVNSAWINIAQGIMLTALILFLFLYNFRSTLVVAITMPLTIVIGLFFMQFFDFTLNTSTLLAIGMSIGILATNSIVVLEAIVKRLDKTSNPKESSRLGASEAVIAVLASAGTNIVVLFPIAMMGGRVGLFLKPLALTMVIMTAVSLFISFTLTPMLCSILLKPKNSKSTFVLTKMEHQWNKMFSFIISRYRAVLAFNEQNRPIAVLVLVIVIILFAHSLSLTRTIGFGFFEEPDQGQVVVKLEFPTRYDLKQTERRMHDVERRLKDMPELKNMLAAIGKAEGIIGQSSEGVYLAQILLKFSERDQRTLTIDQLQDKVRSRLADFPECIVIVNVMTIVGGQMSDIEMEIAGDELDTLDSLAIKSKKLADEIDGFLDSDTTARIGKPELRIYPQRAVLADLGIPATSLGIALRANLEGIEAGTFKKGARNYDIVVELQEEESKQQIAEFLFPGVPGKPVLLTNLGQIERRLSPVQITRKNKRRVSKLFANIKSTMPLGSAVSLLSSAIDQKGHLPPGYDYEFAGQYEAMAEAQIELAEAAIVAVILVILTLAAILESFKQPWLILVTIPLALIGVFWALALTGQSLSMFVLMSIVMMTGIVVNNAILIMDQFNVHVKEGIPRHKAMITAATERFRPIVMITLAAILGMMPLAIGQGIGAELRNGVGIASVGGILISGILTLVVMPILYDFSTRKQNSIKD